MSGVTPEVLNVSPSLSADEDTVAALGPVLHSLQSGATKGGLINIHLGETEHLEETPWEMHHHCFVFPPQEPLK